MIARRNSSPFPSCFRPTSRHRSLPPPPQPPLTNSTTTSSTSSSNPNLTTCLYQTHLGLFVLTWSRNLFGRSLHLLLLPNNHHHHHSLSSTPSFHLNVKPFIFWKKNGSKELTFPGGAPKSRKFLIYWDLTRAKFGSGPEPDSGFYIAVLVDGEIELLVGDSEKEAYAKTKAKMARKQQALVIRREHVFGNGFYSTKANFGGKTREISIECNTNNDDPKLSIKFDQKRVLQIKHLKWKFRGNERIEVDGQPIQLSWDVYNWLFEDDNDDGYALFTFRFEKTSFFEEEEEERGKGARGGEKNDLGQRILWSNDSCGLNFERKKMKKRMLKTRSASSSSLSSASSGCSSVMEWESVEENELKGPTGFSLLVYAWKN